jgi:hypothetical protein
MESGSIEPERCEELWFKDGNLIISAHETDPESGSVRAIMQFRVYRGLLQNETEPSGILNVDGLISEKLDGCDVLPLFGDPCEDVKQVLKLIFTR